MVEYKGLLIGRNPINMSTGNGKTLCTFFNSFKASNLSQIYVSNLDIDRNVCGEYLHLSEKAALCSGFSGKVTNAIIPNSQNGDIETDQVFGKAIVSFLRIIFRSQIGLYIRDYLWRRRKWFTDDIKNWIKKQKPDFLFYDVGNLSFEYEMVKEATENLKIPLVLYVSDDYIYDERKTINLISKKKVKAFEDIAQLASFIIVISEAMKVKYAQHIDTKYVVAMNGCDDTFNFTDYLAGRMNYTIVYTGNLGIGRLKVLQNFCQALSKDTSQSKFFLNIYSSFNISNRNRALIESTHTAKFCGTVYGDSLKKVWDEAGILLHVESSKRKYRNILSTAISTKIPEYMLSGRPILIIAPDYSEVANFVLQHNFGFVVSSNRKCYLLAVLKRIIENNGNETIIKIENAKIYAQKELTKKVVSHRIFEEIKASCEKR